jgi:hypothetical protein
MTPLAFGVGRGPAAIVQMFMVSTGPARVVALA